MPLNILRVDASAQTSASVSRGLSDAIVARLSPDGGASVTTRDLNNSIAPVNESWVHANFTPAADRSDAQRETLVFSDSLIAELKAADVIVIGVPMYNFTIPAALKSWIDQIARVGVTFHYTETGPVGLLEGKRAILALASGGVPMDSPMDFATGYMRQILGFIGITDVEVINASGLMSGAEEIVKAAHEAVTSLKVAG